MKAVLLDTNVLLDVLLQRTPWVQAAARIWAAGDSGLLRICLTATTITDIFYVAQKLKGNSVAIQAVKLCLTAFEILAVDGLRLEMALQQLGPDFEDNLQMVCAREHRLQAIVTRDSTGFGTSPVPVWTPEECCQNLKL